MSSDKTELIYGVNPVREALMAGKRPIRRLIVQEGGGRPVIREICQLARQSGIRVEVLSRAAFSSKCPVQASQGVAAELLAKTSLPLEELLDLSLSRPEPPLLLLLDGVEDPRNLGAIIRTAECSGVHGLVLPERRSAGVGVTAAKTSAGAVEFVDFSIVVNLRQAMRRLRDAGLVVVGAHAEATSWAWEVDFRQPLAIVLGGEDRGLRPSVRSDCDHLVRLPRLGQVGSLNVSVAAGMLLYETRRQRAVH